MSKIKFIGKLANIKVQDCDEKQWERAYKKISKITGLKLEETLRHSYCIVTDKDNELFGEIGVYDYSEHYSDYFIFKGKNESKGFGSFKKSSRYEIFWAKNVIMLLEEMEKLD